MALSLVTFGISQAVSAVRAASANKQLANAATQPTDGLGDLDWSLVDKKGVTRYEHVMKHAVPNPNKATHTIFSGDPIAMTNQAWNMRGGVIPIAEGNNFVYNIPFINAGIAGENTIRIITMANTNILVSAYPIFIPI